MIFPELEQLLRVVATNPAMPDEARRKVITLIEAHCRRMGFLEGVKAAESIFGPVPTDKYPQLEKILDDYEKKHPLT